MFFANNVALEFVSSCLWHIYTCADVFDNRVTVHEGTERGLGSPRVVEFLL